MQVKSIAECSKGSILQFFLPSLSYLLSLRSLFCLFLSGRLRQVLLYLNSFKGDWLMGMKYAERLCKESRWSKATYTYQKAAFLMMCADQTEDTTAHLKYLMG